MLRPPRMRRAAFRRRTPQILPRHRRWPGLVRPPGPRACARVAGQGADARVNQVVAWPARDAMAGMARMGETRRCLVTRWTGYYLIADGTLTWPSARSWAGGRPSWVARSPAIAHP